MTRTRRPSTGGGENQPPAEPTRRRWNVRGVRGVRGDRGASILEFAGFLPILLLVGMAAIQLGLIGYGVNQAGTAARAAARAESLNPGTGGAAGQAAASQWLDPVVEPGGGGGDTVTATVVVNVPSVIPLFDVPPIERSVTMPNDNDGV
ncbi:TadE family protein [Streptomyces acidicola]|uniref:TadE family protein n=1 Tax=Streptomyces acidicola TaxID=2596892 RepID=UPI0034120149